MLADAISDVLGLETLMATRSPVRGRSHCVMERFHLIRSIFWDAVTEPVLVKASPRQLVLAQKLHLFNGELLNSRLVPSEGVSTL